MALIVNEVGNGSSRCGGALFHVVDYCTVFFFVKQKVGQVFGAGLKSPEKKLKRRGS